jgi:membrane fusion protein, multidrug efflux system
VDDSSGDNKDATATSTPDPEPQPAAEAAPRRQRRWLRTILLTLGPVVVLVAGFAYYATGGRYVGTDDAYVAANHVLIAPQVTGNVATVVVEENQHVETGDLLFGLDDGAFRIAVAHAEANLSIARATVEALKATLSQVRQQLAQARNTAAYAQDQYARKQSLADSGDVSDTVLETAAHERDSARRGVDVLDQEIAGIIAKLNGDPDIVTNDHPTVLAAQAALDEARLNLAHTQIYAPFPGSVSNVPHPGQHLDAGAPALALIGDTQMWIDANLKETDLTNVREGQAVTIAIDAYPDHSFTGTVESISQATGSVLSVLPAQNASGNWVKVVQRLEVRIALDGTDADTPLRAGMSALVSIDTGHSRSLPWGLDALARLLGGNPAP